MRSLGRILLLMIVAGAFGAFESVFKGNGAGVRDGIGNLSAPWVILPLLAGALGSRGSISLGAVVGLLTTLAALVGFYLANAFVLDLGPHSSLHDIGLTLDVGNLWFKAGALSGPAMGALGAWASRRGGIVVAWTAVGLVLFEPLGCLPRVSGPRRQLRRGGWRVERRLCSRSRSRRDRCRDALACHGQSGATDPGHHAVTWVQFAAVTARATWRIEYQ